MYDKKFKFLNKLLISCLCMMLVFNLLIMPKKTDAFHPALLWVAGSLVADVAADIGWKYVAKPAYEAILKKVTNKVVANADTFDFPKKKPKKNGSNIDIDITPIDRAKIATQLKNEFKNIKKLDIDRQTKMTNPTFDIDVQDTDPLYNTSVHLNLKKGSKLGDEKILDYVKRFFDVEFKPNAWDKSSDVTFKNIVTDEVVILERLLGTEPYGEYDVFIGAGTSSSRMDVRFTGLNISRSSTGFLYNYKDSIAFSMYEDFLRQLENNNRVIYVAQGISVPDDNTKIYDIPIDTPSDFKHPNADNLDIDITVPITLTDLPDTADIDWDDLVNYETDINNYYTQVIDQGDITKNNTIIINNFYGQIEGGPSQDDIDDLLPSTGGGSGTPAEIPSNFFDLMSEMGGKIIDMYNGVTHFLENGVEGMKTLADGTAGLVDFLDDFFSWLPVEYRTLFGSAFMFGVVAFFLRR